MEEALEVEFVGGPLDGERHLFAIADLFSKSRTGELLVSDDSEDGLTHSYRLVPIEYRYMGEIE